MNRADYIVILTLVAMAMLTVSWATRADSWASNYSSECPTWARLVERIEAMPEAERDWSLWMKSADKIVQRYILSARNWIEFGRTSQQAWSECDSY